MKKRIFFSDDGTFTDYTSSLNDYYSGSATFSYVTGEDYWYIGTVLPLNHLYCVVATANDTTASLTVQYWDGSQWQDTVDVIDDTSASGVSLAQSGFIEWVSRKGDKWGYEDTVNIDATATNIIGFPLTTVVHDMYWTRWKWNANLKASTIISWIGQLFSTDDDLGAEFPDLVRTNTMAAFESGKTDWKEQAHVAAKVIQKDLIERKTMWDENQILTREDLTLASVQKVAQIIYGALGDDYTDQRDAAAKEYQIRLSKAYVKVDNNKNANVDINERMPTTGTFLR